MIKTVIAGVGYYVPEKVVTNKDLEQFMDTSHNWIVERTGIEERRYRKDETETTAVLGARAAEKAMEMAGVTAKDIDLILFATLSPDYYFPGSGVVVQDILGCDTIGALDIRNQCSGFIYGLNTADAFVKSGMYKNVLLIGAEVHSFALDMSTRGRSVSVIFGDGAGAVVLQPSEDPNRGIITSNLHSEGKFAENLAVRFPGSKYGWGKKITEDGTIHPDRYPDKVFPNMDGPLVFKNAVVRFPQSIKEAFETSGEDINDLKLFIPHQANLRISQMVQSNLGLRDDQVYNNIMRYGNTTAATLPIALGEAYEQKLFDKGDLICLSAFGSGFTWGSTLLRW